MADFGLIKQNVKKLIDGGAPDNVIQSYLSDEGVTPDDLKIASIDFNRPRAAVRADIDKLGPDLRPKALNAWAQEFVKRERKGSGIGTAIGDVVRNVARGTPVGSWLDEANAMTQAGQYALGLGGSPYDEAKAYQNALDKAAEDDSTKLGSLPVIGDVKGSGVSKVVGGVLSAPLAPVARIMQGATMLPQMVNAGISGLGYGALYGAGEGNTGVERAMNAGVGAATGLGVGAAAPPVAAGIGRVLRRAPRPQGPLAQYDRTAVRNVTDDMINDDLPVMRNPRGPTGATDEVQTLADMGENLRGHAGFLARMPGRGKTLVYDTLGRDIYSGRRGQAPARINADLDANLGPAQDMVQRVDDVVTHYNRAARPDYRQFENMDIAMTPAMQRVLQRAEGAPGVMEQAQRLMQLEGYNPGNNVTGRFVDYIRRGVDDLAQGAERGTNERRLYERLSRQLNGTIDAQLRARSRAGGGPDFSVYQRARNTSAIGQQFREGAELGRDVFKRQTHPDELRAEMQRMQPPGIVGLREGSRGALRNMMGEAASGDATVRRNLGGEFAQDKLNQVLGNPQAAANIMRRVDLENAYEQTRQAATGNSITSTMMQNARRYQANDLPGLRQAVPSNLWNDIRRAATWIGDRLSQGATAEARERVAYDAARLLMAQGQNRDRIIRELAAFVQDSNNSMQARSAIERVLSLVLRGSRDAAISNAAIGGAGTP